MPEGYIEIPSPQDTATGLPPEEVIFGRDSAMQEIHEKLLKVADTEVPVLIRGESGTGKEVIAKFMHLHSGWKSGPFVKVHCPAIPETLLESELFGYEEGAFTGANASKQGRVEAANGGTLLLDEIAELSAPSQAKLLQMLQDGQVFRIGARKGYDVQVRIVCATHRPVEQDIHHGTFRADLFYRISVVTLRLPPLRERREDIPAIADYFLKFYSKKIGRPVQPLTSYLLRLLQESPWPGNIRELENLINRYVILGSEDVITDALLGGESEPAPSQSALGLDVSLRRIARNAARGAERKAILQVLNANQGNRKKTARTLNISYRSLLYKIRDAGIPRKGAPERRVAEAPLLLEPSGKGMGYEPPKE